MGIFTLLGRLITKVPPLWVMVMPAISILLVIFGFQDFNVETSVSKLWIPESTTYAADSRYTESIIGGPSSSNFLAISVPRKGGNVMTATLLLELLERLNKTQNTKVSVDGMTFSFDDVCYNPAMPYVLPCFRMNVLDCFAEGSYDFSNVAAKTWRGMAETEALARSGPMKAALIAKYTPKAMQDGLDELVDAVYEPIVKTGLVQSSPCNATCTFDGLPAMIAKALNMPAGSWESNTTCEMCLNMTLNQLNQTAQGRMQRDFVYNQVLLGMIRQLLQKPSLTAQTLELIFNTSSEKEALNMALKNSSQVVAFVSPKVKIGLEAAVDLQIKMGVEKEFEHETPYTYQTSPPEKVGKSRPHLRDPKTLKLATDAEVLAAASGTCYAWDGGQALPANLDVLLYGSPMPTNFSAEEPLTSVEALQHVYRLLMPEDLVERLSTRPVWHGGTLEITEDQAKSVMKAYKKAFEETFSSDWNNNAVTGTALQNTAFSDDTGAAGTFARTLSELTTDSVPLIAIYAGLTVVLSALFFVSRNCVASQVVLIAFGSLFAILGCFAALGLSLLCGISLNVVHFWIMPFIIIGIGIDDMFMLALSSQTVNAGSTPEAFAQAFANVAVPVTMTSLVNAAMFAIMSFTSDIQAVYQAGYTGLMATFILYLTMLISFSALVYLDSQRRAGSRYDCLPCLKSSTRQEGDKPPLSRRFYNAVYKPATTSCGGRVLILLASTGLLVAAAVGLWDLPVGLDLQDFFPAGTAAGKFAQDRNEYFPVWPVALNWGELNYTDPNVQLQMAQEWEQVLSTKYVAGKDLKTTLVWTAKLAEWGINNTDATCRSVMKENTLGLKLKGEGGFCRAQGCPVLEGFSQDQLARCIAKWKSDPRIHDYKVIAPAIKFDANGTTPLVPIRFSTASGGGTLFAYNLRTTQDYTNMIKETRKYMDDDTSFHNWMSGIPFDFWEQYLSIVQVMVMIGGLSILAGFVISSVFIFIELSISQRGTCLKRLCASVLGALLIANVSAASLITVVGFCGLANIQLSGFTAMSCVMSTGLAVEYSVHVVHRFLEAPPGTAIDRIHYAMEWLFSPTSMAFLTSALSVLMMAFSEFVFVRLYFFAPLACAVLTSYFFGVFTLPCLLGCLDCVPLLASSPADKSSDGADDKVNEIEEPNRQVNEIEEPKTPLGSV